jgi:hypothetical protein
MGHAGQLTNAAGPAGPGRTTKRRTALVVLASLFSALAALVGSAGPASASTITSPGPLTNITISPDLNCAVNHVQDSAGEFYGDTACGTLLATGGTLFGPASIPAGGGASPRTGFTPVSQASGGSGTSADPFTIVTVVDAGTTGVRLTQTDSYVVGQESYRTDTQVTNTGAAPLSAVLYKAGDCYLQNSDLGFGAYDAATGAVSCVAGVDDGTGTVVPGSRIEQFFPVDPGQQLPRVLLQQRVGRGGDATAPAQPVRPVRRLRGQRHRAQLEPQPCAGSLGRRLPLHHVLAARDRPPDHHQDR